MQPLTQAVILYASPPIIHPSKSLVVWPLSVGDVLFADFQANTYFIRKLGPSATHSKFCLSTSRGLEVLETPFSAVHLHEVSFFHVWPYREILDPAGASE